MASPRSTDHGDLPRLLLIGILGCWLLFPFLQRGLLAEDAIPFIAAGRVVTSQPKELYSDDDRGGTPPLVAAGCPLAPSGSRCDSVVGPFLSPPQVLPIMAAIGKLNDGGTILFMRLVSVLAFIGGMWALWQRVARKTPSARAPMTVAAGLLTPFVYETVAFGQNGPLMFLSACLGLTQTDRGSRAAGAAAVWVTTVLFKVFPLPLIALAVIRRRWKFVAWSLGLIAAMTIVTLTLAPTSLYGQFLDTSRVVTANRVASPWNVSVDSMIHSFDPSWRAAGAAFYGVLALRLAVFGSLWWWKLRDADDDVQWAWAWVALLALHPQIWWHYLALIVPAIALVVATRGRRAGRLWWLVPGAAATTIPLALVTDTGHLQLYAPLLLLATTLVLPFLVGPSRPPSATPEIGSSDAPTDLVGDPVT